MPKTIAGRADGPRVRSRFSFRAFYIAVSLVSALAVISFAADQAAQYRHGENYGVLQRRTAVGLDSARLSKRDEECRLVHFAEDKCAFIKANCPDEEAGLLSYLSLYYCSLPNAQPLAFVILVIWMGLLFSTIGIAASDFFCINLSTIANILGMSESMAGVTFLAFGNGSPDVFSTFAAMNSHSGSLAVGELIGAAGFITAVVAGTMAIIREFKVGKKTFVRDVGFFIVATSFSMMFLADGVLHLWECCFMIGFYIFYVVTVVGWHWNQQRLRRKKERIAAERGHYNIPGNTDIEVEEHYFDDEDISTAERRSMLSRQSTEDIEVLDRGTLPVVEVDLAYLDGEESEDREERRLATEMSNSMRVVRPVGARRNTINPIRPSLVGAMEFRSVLASLQRSRGAPPRPIHLRRYSDDSRVFEDQSRSQSAIPLGHDEDVPVIKGAEEYDGPRDYAGSSSRARAVSMNDLSNVRYTNAFATSEVLLPLIEDTNTTDNASTLAVAPASPSFSISPPVTGNSSRDVSPMDSLGRRKHRDRLAPPDAGYPGARHLRNELQDDNPNWLSPQRPHLVIPGSNRKTASQSSSPILQFPVYTDSPLSAPSLMLPDSVLPSSEAYHQGSSSLHSSNDDTPRHVNWWPYSHLPDPWVILGTVFPTLTTWSEKGFFDKVLSVLSAPSIFLLAITLPVVESETEEAEEEESYASPHPHRSRTKSTATPMLPPEISTEEGQPGYEWQRYRRNTLSYDHGLRASLSPALKGLAGRGTTAETAINAESTHRVYDSPSPRSPAFPFPSKFAEPSRQTTLRQATLPLSPKQSEIDPHSEIQPTKDWNRWLVIIQIFSAPLFVMLIIWANSDTSSNSRLLLHLILYSLLGSMIALSILLLTTNPYTPPRIRPILCFFGFVVSITWISTIANEVVGVLKAIGVIVGISDAILGLTIFAVGNSLGDLVADMTVARLGYPVMALSACFGGPMLNILLGIGCGGLYMMVITANHKHDKHPGQPLKYKPYEIEVSGTLMISGITLLVTLVGLLIAVPLNKWVMSKKIGVGLISLWVVSTIINVIVEITGVL